MTVDFQKVWQIKCNEEDLERLRMVRKAFTDNGFCADFWVFTPRMFHRCYADRLHHYIINYDGRVFKCTAQDYADDKVLGRLGQDGHIEWSDKLRSSLFSHPTFDNERAWLVNCCLYAWGHASQSARRLATQATLCPVWSKTPSLLLMNL